jgi:hypothetical protein
MAINQYLKNERTNVLARPGSAAGLPNLSHNLDSIRTYNYEVQFNGTFANVSNRSLTLAAKRVQSAGQSVEDIAVRRLNDLYHYPGAANNQDLIITFDHLLLDQPVAALYEWFRNGSYNVRTGVVNNAERAKQHSIDVIYYDNEKTVNSITSYYGVFVANFAPGEHNYTTANEFHTFDVTFRYDFMEYAKSGTPLPGLVGPTN